MTIIKTTRKFIQGFLFPLVRFLAPGQSITIKDLSGYLSSSGKDTTGYQFIQEGTKADSVQHQAVAVIAIKGL